MKQTLGSRRLRVISIGVVLVMISLWGSGTLWAGISGTRLNGITYYSLRDVAGRLGMQYANSHEKKNVYLRSRWSDLSFTADRRKFFLNNLKLFLGNAIALHRGTLYISQRDYEKTLSPILTPQIFANAPKLYRIVIDPGHGGKDPGAQNKALGLDEKALALDVSKRLRQKLRSFGYDVHLTRDKDVYVGLQKRTQFANRIKADLFISVHFNAIKDTKVRGVECFTFTPPYQPSSHRDKLHASDKKFYPANRNDTWNQLAGYALQRALMKDVGGIDRGLKRARWTVLKELQCPGVLVELGFLTHDAEARLIRQADYRKQLVNAVTQGVLVYQKALNRIRARQQG